MDKFAFTRMSSEGQVVILKAITPLKVCSFESLIAQARQQAEETGMQPSNITDAIAEVRERD